MAESVNDLNEARAVMARALSLVQAAGLAMRPPPPEPTTCCGRGCSGCVWEAYFAAVAYWQQEAQALLALTRRSGAAFPPAPAS